MDNAELLGMLNRFTRRELSEDEVYIFTVVLCDNEIDRDNERFSRKSLEEMSEKFIGVTGIFDHDPKGGNQTARLFMTEVIEEDRENSVGEKYAYLKGYAYMVRTASNADLICEIEGGIKKEVSVSCSAERQICSVCGADRRVKACRHAKGRVYDGKKCFFSLEDISDVYEWSFVAVPAQVCAGVTRKSCGDEENRSAAEARIVRTLILKDSHGYAKKVFEAVKEKLSCGELEELGFALEAGKACLCENCDEYMM